MSPTSSSMSMPTARSAPGSPRRWEQNDKATEFTLHLKSGVTFSDGTPLDASAVVANLDIWHAGRKNEGINPIGLFRKTLCAAPRRSMRTR